MSWNNKQRAFEETHNFVTTKTLRDPIVRVSGTIVCNPQAWHLSTRGAKSKLVVKKETEQALSWKQDSISGQSVNLAICPISMETTNQQENQAPGRKSPRAPHHLKEYPNYLCDWIESYILLCLSGYDHKPIDHCPLLTT